MKTLIKSVIIFIIAATIIYFLFSKNLLDIKSFATALERHKIILCIIAFLQVLNCVFMSLRYFKLLKIFDVQVRFSNVISASFVGNAIGQWMPGALAFIEIIRIGLLFGATQEQQKNTSAEYHPTSTPVSEQHHKPIGLRSRLVIVSLFDRLIGFFAMLLAAFIVTGVIFAKHVLEKDTPFSQSYPLFFFFLLSTGLLSILISLPFASKSILLRRLLGKVEHGLLFVFRRGAPNQIIKKLFHELFALLNAVAAGCQKIVFFIVPLTYSVLCVLSLSLSIYLSALALDQHIPLSVILATTAIINLTAMLPISFGGLGGIQLVAMATLSIFGVSAQTAASAQFLQNSLNLVSVSFAGLFFVKLSLRQIKSLIAYRKIQSSA